MSRIVDISDNPLKKLAARASTTELAIETLNQHIREIYEKLYKLDVFAAAAFKKLGVDSKALVEEINAEIKQTSEAASQESEDSSAPKSA